MLKSIKQIAESVLKCDHCGAALDLSKDRWLYQDDGSYIHIDCIEPALEAYKVAMDKDMRDWELKLLSKLDPREPFGIEAWHEECEYGCGFVAHSPNEMHNCSELI